MIEYNPLPDLLILGGFLAALTVIMCATRKRPTGAETAKRKDIESHQAERRIRMADGDYK